ncbi:YraN family protein [Actinokineospora globicatena]|uniref:UPF0102 protein Aglo03_53290 n=1 Tax=Actinokineospora globicatena TaxID=103729 RepID=A0A9W6QTB0_9PSEU|nr:YraN family protein [Actinokineospora globicatena]MCP2305597.1 putative endonuclease [Actinokineospora globicatena]GLW81467.1 UPF0102 protein [Actinokineospora globicatena]GLW87835.1 UPF0102 protein [Actinokineospora globicatena]GLW94513.1 UPF0102 protein [Actinokineospora globicatena]
MARHLRLGSRGEDIAAHHLQRQGLRVLARNWRCDLGELDLICATPTHLVVCEVKTRTSTRHGTPTEAVTATKAHRIRTLTHRWRLDTGHPPTPTRYDVIAVLIPPHGTPTLHHHRGIL